MDEPFKPNGFEVKPSIDGQDVLLVFEADGVEPVSVELPTRQLPALVRLLQREIAPGQETPIDLVSLRPGASVAVSQTEVSVGDGGSVRITLGASLSDPERFVTIPFVADRVGAWGLLEDLVSALKRGE